MALEEASESDPVQDEEDVLRRIPNNQDFVNRDGTFGWLAFKPDKRRDLDGLSVFRRLFTTPEALVEKGRSKSGYYAVGLTAGEIRDLGRARAYDLDVISKPDPEQLPGHSVIPQLGPGARRHEKFREILVELAALANNGVLLAPGDA